MNVQVNIFAEQCSALEPEIYPLQSPSTLNRVHVLSVPRAQSRDLKAGDETQSQRP